MVSMLSGMVSQLLIATSSIERESLTTVPRLSPPGTVVSLLAAPQETAKAKNPDLELSVRMTDEEWHWTRDLSASSCRPESWLATPTPHSVALSQKAMSVKAACLVRDR